MVLEAIFGFLLNYEPVLAVTIYSIFVLVLINIFYKILIKQHAAKELKAQTKELSKKMREAQKAGDTSAASKLMTEVMQQNAKLMRMTLKPMITSIIIVIVLLPFLSDSYPDIHVGISDKAGNFTLNGNRYDVMKDGSNITIMNAMQAINCGSFCIQVENNWYKMQEDGKDVKLARVVTFLPVPMPFVGTTLGWLGWYILVSIPLVILLRKIMKIYI